MSLNNNYIFYISPNYEIYITDEFVLESQFMRIEIAKVLNLVDKYDWHKNDFNDNDINTYDLSVADLNNVIDDANTLSLFSDNKLIICTNSHLFTASAKANTILEKYLENPNKQTTIIFTLNTEKIDSRKKSVKLIKKIGSIIECNDNSDITSFIKNEFKGYNITNKEINLLKNRVGNNLDILSSEIEKIKIYKDNNKTITEEDIINLTIENVHLWNGTVDPYLYTAKVSIIRNGEELDSISSSFNLSIFSMSYSE